MAKRKKKTREEEDLGPDDREGYFVGDLDEGGITMSGPEDEDEDLLAKLEELEAQRAAAQSPKSQVGSSKLDALRKRSE